MTTNGQARDGTAIVPTLGFVAVLDPKGRPDATLNAILPDLFIGGYHVRATEDLAMAVDTSSESVTVTCIEEREVILLGSMVSELVGPADALNWAVSAVVNGRYGELKMLQGVFALIVVDLPKQTVWVVSDLLGIRPFYVATRDGVTILSDRAEAAARLEGAKLDPLGLAGWMYFRHPLANRTLFKSVERYAPATVTMFDGQSVWAEEYWDPTVAEEPIDREDLMDDVYEDFRRSLLRLLKPYDAGTVTLSGGFDSRLCLLTALRENVVSLDAITVPCSQGEREVVNRLVDMTGIECERVDRKKSFSDRDDLLWYLHPDGFWRWRNLCYLCATHFGKSRLFIDGSLSDVAVRTHAGDPKGGPPADETEARAYVFWHHTRNQAFKSYFRSEPLARFEQLAHQAADEQSDAIGWNSKFCIRWNAYTDERRNIACNFLQYADLAPSVQPFYDRALMERRLRHPNRLFTDDFYRALLKRQFPGSGELPHEKDLPRANLTKYRFRWTLWRELPSIVRFVRRHRDVLRSDWILPRIFGYGLGRRSHMYVVLELMQFVKLEREMNRFGVDLDFTRVSS